MIQVSSNPLGLFQQVFTSIEFTEGANERFQQIETLVASSVNIIEDKRVQIESAMLECKQKTEEMTKKCHDFTSGLISKLGSLREDDFKKAQFLIQLSSEVNKRYFETTTQLLHLTRLCEERGFAQNKGFIEGVFLERMKELELCIARVQLITEQQNHDLEVTTIIHNQQLKQEAQRLDQWMETTSFVDQQKQREFSQKILEREKKRTDDVAYQKLATERVQKK